MTGQEPGGRIGRPRPIESTGLVAERIERVVRLRTGGLIRGLRVEVGDDRVVLTGRTASFYNKQLATHAALAALGGGTLSNLIEVN